MLSVMTDPVAGYNLVHPVYLDVPMMVSFLAHIEGGVSVDEEQTSTATGARERLLKGRAGLRLRFAPVVGGEAAAEGSTQKRDEESLELKTSRHHTAASLFNLLYDYLIEDKQVVSLTDPAQLSDVRIGQLVEVVGEYLGNPLEETLAFVGAIIPYVLAQEEMQKEAAKNTRTQQKRTNSSGRRSSSPDPQAVAAAALQELVQQATDQSKETGMRIAMQMSDDIKNVPVHDVLLRTSTGLNAVLTVDSSYYSPATNEYLRAGEFRVVGKVTRVIGGDRKINLTRRTVMGAAGPEMAREIVSSMKSENFSLDVPDPIVEAPAVQILPMAVFL